METLKEDQIYREISTPNISVSLTEYNKKSINMYFMAFLRLVDCKGKQYGVVTRPLKLSV